jgi:hypothetical protein
LSVSSPFAGDPTLEASITIEGTVLSYSQAMALRVAVQIFIFQLQENREGYGKATADGYLARLAEIQALIGRGAR